MPLRLDLLRHGEAVPHCADGDAARPLSPTGIRTIRTLGLRLAAEGWHPDLVLASPFERAQETALMLAQAADFGGPLLPLRELSPGHTPEELAQAVAERVHDARHLLLVGHQPLLGDLLFRLTGAEAAVRPGTMLHLAVGPGLAPGAGRLVHTLDPTVYMRPAGH